MRITRVTSCSAEEGTDARPLRGKCRITGRKSKVPCKRQAYNAVVCGWRGSESTPGCQGAGAPVGGRCSSETTKEGPPSHREDLRNHWVIEAHRQFMPTTETVSRSLIIRDQQHDAAQFRFPTSQSRLKLLADGAVPSAAGPCPLLARQDRDLFSNAARARHAHTLFRTSPYSTWPCTRTTPPQKLFRDQD